MSLLGSSVSMALAGVIVQSVFFGIYIFLFGCSVFVFLKTRWQRKDISLVILISCPLLFLLNCTHWVVNIAIIFDAFVFRMESSSDPATVLSMPGDVKPILLNAIYVFEIIVADIAMIYRLHVIWNRTYRLIICPSFTLVAFTVAGIGVIISYANGKFGATDTHAASVWKVVGFATTLGTNTYCTALIIYRLWSTNRPLIGIKQESIKPIADMFVESFFLSSLFITFQHVTTFVGAPLHWAITPAASPAIGIAYSILILRVGLEGLIPETARQSIQIVQMDTTESPSHVLEVVGKKSSLDDHQD